MILLLLVCTLSSMHAQYEANAYRFSTQKPFGTARFAAQGGAIGALGGDLSAIQVNPAGLGFYRTPEFSISPSFYWVNSTSDFMDVNSRDSKFRFTLGSLGFVGTIPGRNQKVKFSYSLGYNTLVNFSNTTTMRGYNAANSLLDDFTWHANISPNDLDLFYEQVAVDAGLIFQDPSGTFTNDLRNGGYGQQMERISEQSGNIGEYSLSGALNISDFLYLGATAGIHSVRFNEDIYHSETDMDNQIDTLNSFRFWEENSTQGWGYTFRFGVIIRPIKILRIGGSIQTPVWYQLSEERVTETNAYFDSNSGLDDSYAYSPFGIYDYRLTSPMRVNGQASVILFRMATISAAYEFVDYSSAYLHAYDDSFLEENAWIENEMKSVHNIRAGAEVRLIKVLYLRAGVQYLMNPFTDSRIDATEWIYSGGIGFRTKRVFFDASYSFGTHDEVYRLYSQAPGDAVVSNNAFGTNNLMFTLGLKF